MNKLDKLREQFEKRRVLEMPEIMRLLGTTSRMTAYRYLRKLNHLSSYSHNGKFYTLRKLVKFDESGLCSLGNIGFSEHGTLLDTIAHVVKNSEAGKTSSELEHQYHVRVKNALLGLVETKRITREKWEKKLFVYLSTEQSIRQQQLKKRREMRGILPDWVVLEVLVETIRASDEVANAHVIALRLLKRGSLINQEQVQQVFDMYDLEKKNTGLYALTLLSALQSHMTQRISSSNLFPTSPTIKVEPEQTECCGHRLLTRQTRERSVVTLSIGKIHIHETVKQCMACKKIYTPELPSQYVPQHCNFGFDVMVYVGKALFQNHQTENEIVEALRCQNVLISEREVSYLGKKFICYLALAHQDKVPEIRRLIEDNGGSCLHFDGTNDGGSPHLIVAVDEVERLVLGSIKATSESTESVSSLLKQVKRDYGDPLALVHDLGKANLSAVQIVFPGIADYVCHFHFLRDIGKDLFGDEDMQIRSILQGYGVKGRLRAFAKKLREFVTADQLQQPLDKKVTSLTSDGLRYLAEADIAYLLAEWILDFTEELSGYGFPFDRERLVFLQRMQKVRELIKALPPSQGDLGTLQEVLDEVLENPLLTKLTTAMEKKSVHFERLREAMRVAEPEGSDGLNDDAIDCDMDVIKTGVEKFINSPEIKALLCNQDYRKMVGQIKKYWEKLFTKPIEVTSKNGQTMTIQPQRTNNLMERFFRELNRGSRRRTGGKSLGRVLLTMLAETPLVKNLENEKYERIILNGCATLSERFAEIEAQQVREKMRQATQDAEKLHPAVKRLIRTPNLPDCLIGTFPRTAARASSPLFESQAAWSSARS